MLVVGIELTPPVSEMWGVGFGRYAPIGRRARRPPMHCPRTVRNSRLSTRRTQFNEGAPLSIYLIKLQPILTTSESLKTLASITARKLIRHAPTYQFGSTSPRQGLTPLKKNILKDKITHRTVYLMSTDLKLNSEYYRRTVTPAG